MIKYINQLNDEELTKVYNNNEALQNQVLDDYEENQLSWIVGDYLEGLKPILSDWSIGFYNRNYLNVEDYEGLVYALQSMQEDYCFLSDDDYKLVEATAQKMDTRDNLDYEDPKYYILEDEIMDDTRRLEDITLEAFNELTEYPNNKYLLEYFIEFYSESRISEEAYIKDDSFILYEDVAYTKDYA